MLQKKILKKKKNNDFFFFQFSTTDICGGLVWESNPNSRIVNIRSLHVVVEKGKKKYCLRSLFSLLTVVRSYCSVCVIAELWLHLDEYLFLQQLSQHSDHSI